MSDEGSGSSSSEEEEFREEKEGGSDEEEEESDEDEDDAPLSSLKKGSNTQSNNSPRRASSSTTGGRAAAAKVTSYAEDGDDDRDDDSDDDDDDKPLASLLKVKPKATADAKKKGDKAKESSSSSKKKKTKDEPLSSPKKKKAKKDPVVSIPSSSSASGNNKYEWSSAALYGTECDKGMLIQRLLCRWWYVSRNRKKKRARPGRLGFEPRSTAMATRWTCTSHRWVACLDILRRYATEWPAKSSLPATPPKNYDALDGFPGVYIGTSGEDVGTLLDLRDKSQAPSFANYLKMSSSGLKELLVKALQEQRRQLLEAEGPGTPTERDIDQMLKWASKVNADKADKEAVKILKAHGFS
jgi:hypothetical protein